jgi:NADP-dependent 3-hydroxy acid dehydrogenase YdfG
LPHFVRERSGHIITVTSTVPPGFTFTDFISSTRDPAVLEHLQTRRDALAMPPEAVSAAIAFALEQPEDIDVGEIIVRPTAQA